MQWFIPRKKVIQHELKQAGHELIKEQPVMFFADLLMIY